MLKGCDISHHQGTVDYKALKDNFDFTIIRATYGDGYKDRQFEVNRDGVRGVGLLTGFYHYAYPQYNAPEAEADWFSKIVSCNPGEILVLDFEETYPSAVDWSLRFLNKVKSNMGFKPYIYLNLKFIKDHDWSPVISEGYPLWLAHWTYDTSPPVSTPWPETKLRQYSNNGNVAGISPLDLNVFYGTVSEYKATGNLAPDDPDTPPPPQPEPDLITPDQFFGKYDQKYLDWDKAFGFQCMDLYRYFVNEVHGFPQSPPVEGADDVWNTYLTEYYDRIENTPTNTPIKGDIVIWNDQIGTKYGHIAVCKDGDPSEFTSFDQNFPMGTPCHFQKHSYYAVLGWLRKKEPTSPEPDPGVPPEPTPEPPVDPCESAVNKAVSENNEIWQARLESANQIIEALKTQTAENLDWKTLFSIAWKKWWSWKKRGD